MIQLPAGTVEPEESAEAAAVRELIEETGVEARLLALAGVRDEEWEGQARRRWVFVFEAPEIVEDEWPFACDCGAHIRCYWLPFETAQIVAPQQPWLELAREHLSLRLD